MNRIQPGQSIITVPGDYLRVVQPRGGAAADWWDPNGAGLCIWAAYQPKGAANLAASYVDLSGNGNNCAPGVAPTWDAVNGWIFNGATQYLTTTFVPQNDQSQTMLIQFTNVILDRHLCGTNEAAGSFYIRPAQGATNVWYVSGGIVFVPPQLLAGNLCVAGNRGYRNGVAEGGAIGAWGGVPALAVYIGCINNFPIGAFSFTDARVQAFALYDCALTAPQVAAVAAAMALL